MPHTKHNQPEGSWKNQTENIRHKVAGEPEAEAAWGKLCAVKSSVGLNGQ